MKINSPKILLAMLGPINPTQLSIHETLIEEGYKIKTKYDHLPLNPPVLKDWATKKKYAPGGGYTPPEIRGRKGRNNRNWHRQ